jgi:hypothetical protein
MPEEAKSLKTFGEPGRTRTCNPLIKSQLLVGVLQKVEQHHPDGGKEPDAC